MPSFLPGLELAAAVYEEVVRGLVDVPHSAALLGTGSTSWASTRSGRPTTAGGRSLPLTGGIDQFVDSTNVLSEPSVFPRIVRLGDVSP